MKKNVNKQRKKTKLRRKANTESKNDFYEKLLKFRELREERGEIKTDFVRTNSERDLHAYKKFREKKHEEEALVKVKVDEYRSLYGSCKPIATYSSSSLNFKEWQRSELQKRLCEDKHNCYTFSKDFQSLAFPLHKDSPPFKSELDPTKPQFKWPFPRSSRESRLLKNVPSSARQKELMEKHWSHEPYQKPKYQKRSQCLGKGEFQLRLKPKTVFGKSDDFKSVHLDLEKFNIKKTKQSVIKNKKQEPTPFKPHFCSRGKPSQLSRFEDILRDAPQKKGLKIIKKVRLPSGKISRLESPPVSIFVSEPT